MIRETRPVFLVAEQKSGTSGCRMSEEKFDLQTNTMQETSLMLSAGACVPMTQLCVSPINKEDSRTL